MRYDGDGRAISAHGGRELGLAHCVGRNPTLGKANEVEHEGEVVVECIYPLLVKDRRQEYWSVIASQGESCPS